MPDKNYMKKKIKTFFNSPETVRSWISVIKEIALLVIKVIHHFTK